ncbi:multidrug resistance protein fer6 [Physcia stellaris]|nr:multidrug resistance protein fer6 [Physcia stellaris]
MAFTHALIALLLSSKCLEATPVAPSPKNRPCIDLMLEVPATAQHAEYEHIHVRSDIEATAFLVDLDTWSSPNPTQRIIRNVTVTNTFNISAQLCIPPHGAKKSHLQIATHGAGFDKRYWDSAFEPAQYSYVDATLSAGYSILTYDRLGTGLSSKPDANTVVQTPIQLDILRSITEIARNGSLLQHVPKAEPKAGNSSTSHVVSFDKIIHVGHSFGSMLTSALLTTYPQLSDGAIITGFIPFDKHSRFLFNLFRLAYAPQNDPTLFADRGEGYMVPETRSAMQSGFFSTRSNTSAMTGGFEPRALDYAFSIRQTFSTGELMTVRAPLLGPQKSFRGPLFYLLAQYDFLVCQGDCSDAFDIESLKMMYPNATNIGNYTQLGSGHGLTLNRGAERGYRAGFEWLRKNGL